MPPHDAANFKNARLQVDIAVTRPDCSTTCSSTSWLLAVSADSVVQRGLQPACAPAATTSHLLLWKLKLLAQLSTLMVVMCAKLVQ
jgi:hypothetical protein